MYTFAQAYEHDRPYDGQVDDHGQFQRVIVGHLEFFHELPLQNYAVEVARHCLFDVVTDVRQIRPGNAVYKNHVHIQPSGRLVAFTGHDNNNGQWTTVRGGSIYDLYRGSRTCLRVAPEHAIRCSLGSRV